MDDTLAEHIMGQYHRCGAGDPASGIVQKMQRWLAGEPVAFYDELGMYDTYKGRDITFEVRNEYIKRYGFFVPCAEVIEACRMHQPLVELGAGSGFLTKLLQLAGVDCIATDVGMSGYSGEWVKSPYAQIEKLQGKTAVRRYRDRNVLMSWPNYEHSWAAQAIKAIHIGRSLLVVHEGRGGCIADDRFFEILERSFQEVCEVPTPVFYGMHDRMAVYRRVRSYRKST